MPPKAFRFFRKARKAAPEPARAPDGERLYAIGDVHGCLDRLDALLERIVEDRAGAKGRSRLIFLGDYVDRGPDSKGVIDRLRTVKAREPDAVFLMGNHEDAMLEALEGGYAARNWLSFGGVETLASYGVDIAGDDQNAIDDAIEAFREAAPEDHLDFIRALALCHVAGGYFFAHAGVRIELPLDRQAPHDLMWIRGEFLDSRLRPDKVIVHGHTPVDAPDDQGWRIDVDTGACYGGALTCVVLDGDTRRFLSV